MLIGKKTCRKHSKRADRWHNSKDMKRFSFIIIFLTFSFVAFSKEYTVSGPQGGLAMEVTLPDDFNEDTDKCPMVILMHGIFSSKNIVPIPALAKALAKEAIASI